MQTSATALKKELSKWGNFVLKPKETSTTGFHIGTDNVWTVRMTAAETSTIFLPPSTLPESAWNSEKVFLSLPVNNVPHTAVSSSTWILSKYTSIAIWLRTWATSWPVWISDMISTPTSSWTCKSWTAVMVLSAKHTELKPKMESSLQ